MLPSSWSLLCPSLNQSYNEQTSYKGFRFKSNSRNKCIYFYFLVYQKKLICSKTYFAKT